VVTESTPWTQTGFEQLNLGDARLNKRARLLMERMAAEPTASVPQACHGWGETMAAYRFFDNEKVQWHAILEPHWLQTQKRMQTHQVVLSLQDTTELDFNAQETIRLGPLTYEAQRGMFVHPTYAVTPRREPLGILDAWMWAREAWKACVLAYVEAGGNPEVIPPWPDIARHKTKLQSLYLNAKEGSTQKLILDELRSRKLQFYPACGEDGTPDTLDHYLPKETYPEFSVTPANLSPTCDARQAEKRSKTVDTQKAGTPSSQGRSHRIDNRVGMIRVSNPESASTFQRKSIS
jgi:hypothetical protein